MEKHPVIKEKKESILITGADKAFMTGSGSTLIGIYPNEIKMKLAIENLTDKGHLVKQVKIMHVN